VYYNLEEVVLFNLGASRSFDPPSSFHILGRVLMAMQDDDDEEGPDSKEMKQKPLI
jgi:hypothetical protein